MIPVRVAREIPGFALGGRRMPCVQIPRRADHATEILVCSGAFLLYAAAAGAQTIVWTGDAGDNVWLENGNWLGNRAPNSGEIALIQTGGTGSNLFLREGSDGIVAVGTLIFAHQSYRNLLAGTQGAEAATILFGGNAAIDVEVPVFEGLGGAVVGDVDGSTPKVTFALPASGRLGVRTRFEMNLNAVIVGSTAGVEFSSLDPDFPATTVIARSAPNSFGGGATITSTGEVRISSPTQLSGGSIVSGPLGTATVTLGGGSLQFRAGDPGVLVQLANPVRLTNDSTVTFGFGSTGFSGPMTLSGWRMAVFGSDGGTLLFNNAGFVPTDSGTIAIQSTALGTTTFDVDLRVDTGSVIFGGAVGEVVNSFPNGVPAPDGSVIKTGTGEFASRHFRVHVMDISAGTLRVNQSSSVAGGTPDFPGSEEGTSRVRRLRLEGVPNPVGSNPPGEANPTVRLDLTNNDLIVDWKGKFSFSPLGTIVNAGTGVTSATGYAGALRVAYMGNGTQAWSGTGITSSVAQQNAGSFAIGYAESGPFFNISGDETATFSGQAVSAEAVLFKFTYQGDFTLDGRTNIADFSILAANFNTPQL